MAVVNPGYDLRTIITAAIVIPILSFTAIGVARMVARLFRRLSKFTAKSIRGVVVEAINGALAPQLDERFDRLVSKFDNMAEENHKAHTEVATRLANAEGRLDSIDDRLRQLESRRRVDVEADR